MKQCKKCKVVKPLGEFYIHKNMADGHLSFCKDCVRERVSAHREKNVEKIREYDNKRNKIRLKDPIYTAKKLVYNRGYRTAKIIKAHNMVDRRLKRPSVCEICGKDTERIDGHHSDYNKPLDVVWCCRICHSAIHKMLMENGVDLHK